MSEIQILEIRYDVFILMMEYLYTGSAPALAVVPAASSEQESMDRMQQVFSKIELVVDLLNAADQFMLDHLKQICELFLQEAVHEDTVEYLLETADRHNAFQLKAVCMHFIRNNNATGT